MVNIQLKIVTCPMHPEKFMLFFVSPFLQLSVVIVAQPKCTAQKQRMKGPWQDLYSENMCHWQGLLTSSEDASIYTAMRHFGVLEIFQDYAVYKLTYLLIYLYMYLLNYW